MVTPKLDRFRFSMAVGAVMLLAALAAGCGGSGETESTPTSTTAAATTSSTRVPVEDPTGTTTGVDDSVEQADKPPSSDDIDAQLPTAEDGDEVAAAPGTDGDTEAPSDQIAALLARLEAEDSTDSPPVPTDALNAYLGGTPDAYAATAIALGLQDAGVELGDIALSVLPIGGIEASLLVLEIGDEYLGSGLLSEAAGASITDALLTLPEIETAAITQLVTLYRGTDEEGPFTMTFLVSIDALRQAHATGGDVGDSLLVQVDRGP